MAARDGDEGGGGRGGVSCFYGNRIPMCFGYLARVE